MKILYGVQQPDEGTIEVERPRRSPCTRPSDAIDAGIGMVFQHFMLADNLTVLENVVLGAEKLHGIGDAARTRDPRDLRRLRPRRRPRRPRRGPRRRRAPAHRDPQGPLPRRQDHHPRRADRGPRAAGGRRALRQPARAEVRGPDRPVHLAQARRGALGRRLDHRDPARHDRRHRRPQVGQRPPARRADGRLRAALARRPRSRRSPTASCSRIEDVVLAARPAAAARARRTSR